jgi:cobalamin-dependent methionine synthase I
MDKAASTARGTMVLATVKGDVHDIGKNLVDIILTNNGYRVVNLGIKCPIETMLHAAEDHHAHAIGMSGLLVKSTLIMKENLEVMNEWTSRFRSFSAGRRTGGVERFAGDHRIRTAPTTCLTACATGADATAVAVTAAVDEEEDKLTHDKIALAQRDDPCTKKFVQR